MLGALVWYSIHDAPVRRQQIVDGLTAAGLDAHFAPLPIHPADAFRRATAEAEHRRLPLPNGTFMNFLMREVKHDGGSVVRHLVREVVDSANLRLDYQEIAQLTLDRRANTVTAAPMAVLTATEQHVLQDAVDRYDLYLDHYQGRHLREVVLQVLRSCEPVSLRSSGGVYFVPQAHQATLHGLEHFVDALSPDSHLWAVTMVDDAKNRRIVAKSLEAEVDGAAERLIDGLRTVLAERAEVPPPYKVKAVEELQRLRDLSTHYQTLLSERLDRVTAQLQVAGQAVQALLLEGGAA
jgi:hypothetical protein